MIFQRPFSLPTLAVDEVGMCRSLIPRVGGLIALRGFNNPGLDPRTPNFNSGLIFFRPSERLARAGEEWQAGWDADPTFDQLHLLKALRGIPIRELDPLLNSPLLGTETIGWHDFAKTLKTKPREQ